MDFISSYERDGELENIMLGYDGVRLLIFHLFGLRFFAISTWTRANTGDS